jgi:hypothetical protein
VRTETPARGPVPAPWRVAVRRLTLPRGDASVRRRLTIAGIALLALVYIAGARQLGAVRWDGLAPSPYRYVKPPPGYTNPGPPAPAKQTIAFSNGVSQSVQVYTPDLQAQLVVPEGAFPANANGSAVVVTLTPQAPPALAGLAVDGNAYVVQAVYADGTPVPAPWKQPGLAYLLFPAGSIPLGLYTLQGSQATQVSTTVDIPSQSVQGQITGPVTIAAAGTPRASNGTGAVGGNLKAIAIAASGLGVLLVAIGLVLVTRRRAGRTPDSTDFDDDLDGRPDA